MTGPGPVLVTGAFGLVGTATIEQLASEGRRVVERRSAYRDAPGVYADPWGIVREHLGDPAALTYAEPRGLNRGLPPRTASILCGINIYSGCGETYIG